MLSDRNIERINDQIETELRTVDTSFTSDEEKLAAIERIAKLKELLTPQPTRHDILSELASALKETNVPTTRSTGDRIVDILESFKR